MVPRYLTAIALGAAGFFSTGLLYADASADLTATVDRSMKAMGAENVKTLAVSGQGWDGCVGQPYNPNTPWWRKFSTKDYVRSGERPQQYRDCRPSAADESHRREMAPSFPGAARAKS
ncbi:MAG: hypothetical protein C5B51_14890 [Terriglobia bacterium]|nr:MAG: hypothetical protein C5B51_14890 [Terriglobia bacterium]